MPEVITLTAAPWEAPPPPEVCAGQRGHALTRIPSGPGLAYYAMEHVFRLVLGQPPTVIVGGGGGGLRPCSMQCRARNGPDEAKSFLGGGGGQTFGTNLKNESFPCRTPPPPSPPVSLAGSVLAALRGRARALLMGVPRSAASGCPAALVQTSSQKRIALVAMGFCLCPAAPPPPSPTHTPALNRTVPRQTHNRKAPNTADRRTTSDPSQPRAGSQ